MQEPGLQQASSQALETLSDVDLLYTPLEQAGAAFAALLARYGQRDAVAITLGGHGAPWVVDLGAATSVDILLDQVQAHVARGLQGDVMAGDHVTLSWYEHGPDAPGACLILHVACEEMRVDGTTSVVRTLMAGADAVERVACHFARVVEAMHLDMHTDVARLPLVSATERHTLLATWGQGERLPYLTRPGLLHDIFARQALRSPQQVAVLHGDEAITYAQLDARVQRLAAGLRSRGIGPGDLVAMYLPRGPEVYAVLLGILHSGAGYVPLDPDWPQERVAQIIADSHAAAVFCAGDMLEDLALPCPVVRIDDDWEWVLPVSPQTHDRQPTPDDVCYVIYTSGSTGRPKGVAITHQSAVHLVRAEQHMFGIHPSDHVFQGFSLAFDAAVEEVWLAFAGGATLVVGTLQAMLDDLPAFLTRQRVTVFSTVPTLLATVTGDLPTVRLLILGGEACPAPLVQRWATPLRRMVNTYGPTEATVIATATALQPGQPVTIGKPIPNYAVYVLDKAGQPVPTGVTGEVCIGGIGLARGYVNNATQTAATFVNNAFAGEEDAPPRLYRTGDAGRYNGDGDIEFLGRLDDQVKLRGFRIELGEIEAALTAMDDITQGVAMVCDDVHGARTIAAYVVPRGGRVEVEACKRTLQRVLPPYMVPTHFEVLTALPTLASGKVNKRALPVPGKGKAQRVIHQHQTPRGALEETIARSFREVLGCAQVGREDDFFLDLGGHSLAAAQVVSTLRTHPTLATLSILDLYQHPTLAGVAALYRERVQTSTLQAVVTEPDANVSTRARRRRQLVCGMAQGVALYGVFGLFSAQWLGPYLMFARLRHWHFGVMPALFAAAGLLMATYPFLLFTAVAAKWLIIGRYKAGRYPLWGVQHFRHWLVGKICALAPTWVLVGTPLLNLYYRVLGMKVGRGVHLASEGIECFDVVHLDDDAVVGVDATLRGCVIEGDALIVGPVYVGKRSVVGPRSSIDPGAALQDDVILDELSRVPRGVTIPAGERWGGSPAQHVAPVDANRPVARPSARRRMALGLLYFISVLLMPSFIVTAILPGLATLGYFEGHLGHWYLLGSPIVAVLFVITMCLEIAAAKWLIVGRLGAGIYHVHSVTLWRKWVFDRTMDISIDVLGGLYATLYLNPWLRLLGVRIGKNAEISTASAITPDLLRIDEEAFLADCVSVGTPRIERGYVTIRETHIGARSFIGNSAIVPQGTRVGADSLLGVLSAAPPIAQAAQQNTSWLGSPSFMLPQRQESTAFSTEATYNPTRRLIAQRLCIEFLRVTLPTTATVAFTCMLFSAAVMLHTHLSLPLFLASFPVLFVALAVGAAATVVALKWLLMGRYRPGERPLWSTFIWRNELITAMHENLVDPMLNEMLMGTPFAPLFFRALGAKIGKGVYLDTTQFTEYDLVRIGNDVTLDSDCTLQTHLFEDRVMKMSRINISDRCSVGDDAVVLYDTCMEPGATLSPLSLLMKGETLPKASHWQGTPARPVC